MCVCVCVSEDRSVAGESVWQEELLQIQTISSCHLGFFFALLYLPQERWWPRSEATTSVGGRSLSKEHRTWSSRASRSHAFSFFELLSAALLWPTGNRVCKGPAHKAAQTASYIQNAHTPHTLMIMMMMMMIFSYHHIYQPFNTNLHCKQIQ